MGYTKDLGLRNFYEMYVENCIKRGKEVRNYKTFTKVIKTFNLKLLDRMVYKSERVTLPRRLGDLYVKKYTRVFDLEDKKNWDVNYEATKKAGYVIYHEDMYGYKWKWSKKTCIVRGKKYYQFKPFRRASRSIADAVKNKKVDYYS